MCFLALVSRENIKSIRKTRNSLLRVLWTAQVFDSVPTCFFSDELNELCAVNTTGPNTGPKERKECEFFKGICANGKCKNTNGSFACECHPGTHSFDYVTTV